MFINFVLNRKAREKEYFNGTMDVFIGLNASPSWIVFKYLSIFTWFI